MIDETTRDIFHSFIIAAIGLVPYFFLSDKLPLERLDIFSVAIFPFIILLATHFNKKTLLSRRFLKLCYYTFIFSAGIPVFIAIYGILTTRPHY